MKTCLECGSVVEDHAITCPDCGAWWADDGTFVRFPPGGSKGSEPTVADTASEVSLSTAIWATLKIGFAFFLVVIALMLLGDGWYAMAASVAAIAVAVGAFSITSLTTTRRAGLIGVGVTSVALCCAGLLVGLLPDAPLRLRLVGFAMFVGGALTLWLGLPRMRARG
jgi:hypothetical protein